MTTVAPAAGRAPAAASTTPPAIAPRAACAPCLPGAPAAPEADAVLVPVCGGATASLDGALRAASAAPVPALGAVSPPAVAPRPCTASASTSAMPLAH